MKINKSRHEISTQMTIINNGRIIKARVGTIECSIEMHFGNEPNCRARVSWPGTYSGINVIKYRCTSIPVAILTTYNDIP